MDKNKLRNILEDLGVDTDDKSEYTQAKWVWKEAQKELLEELEKELKNYDIEEKTLNGLTKRESYNVGVYDSITLIKNKLISIK